MEKFTKKLYQEMLQDIEKISATGAAGFDYYKACYHATIEANRKLKDFILNYRFVDQIHEIKFFKEIKPRFQSQLMCFMELLQIEIQKPLTVDKLLQKKYYKKCSNHYTTLASKDQSFLQYMRSQFDSSDHLLFVRSTKDYDFVHSDLDLDEKYSTPASTKLARLISYDMITKKLAEKIDSLEPTKGSKRVPNHKLTWTGKKAALIELVYALQTTGVINMGKASIPQIIETLEYIFNVSTGQYYRAFQDIRIRQGSRTLFLDELISALNRRMDETDLHGKN